MRSRDVRRDVGMYTKREKTTRKFLRNTEVEERDFSKKKSVSFFWLLSFGDSLIDESLPRNLYDGVVVVLICLSKVNVSTINVGICLSTCQTD